MIVDVVIPCFNVEKYIDECLESVINQNGPVNRIICVDNNSIDSTLEKLNQWRNQDDRIIVKSESKRGASAARNRGLQEVQSDWVQFLDADDLLKPEKIAHQIKLIKNHKDQVDFIVAASKRLKLDGSELATIPNRDPWKALFISALGNTCSNLWRVGSLMKIGGWNEELESSQESDLMFRLLKSGVKVQFDDEVLTIIRDRPSGQISKFNVGQNLLRYAQLRMEIVKHLKVENPEYWKKHRSFFVHHLVILAERLFKMNFRVNSAELLKFIKNEVGVFHWRIKWKVIRLECSMRISF